MDPADWGSWSCSASEDDGTGKWYGKKTFLITHFRDTDCVTLTWCAKKLLGKSIGKWTTRPFCDYWWIHKIVPGPVHIQQQNNRNSKSLKTSSLFLWGWLFINKYRGFKGFSIIFKDALIICLIRFTVYTLAVVLHFIQDQHVRNYWIITLLAFITY